VKCSDLRASGPKIQTRKFLLNIESNLTKLLDLNASVFLVNNTVTTRGHVFDKNLNF
jgi:hypothetical protein